MSKDRLKGIDTGEIHRLLPGVLDEVEMARGLDQITKSLRGLLELVVEDFRAEEGADGLFAQLLRDQPANAPQLRQLEEEHLLMLAKLRGLLAETDRMQEAERSLRAAVLELTGALREHHHLEERLALDTYLQDVGGGG